MKNLTWHQSTITKQHRAQQKNQKPCVLWFTGLSGSGKSTLANLLESHLHLLGCHTYLLDGDNIRYGLNQDLSFDEKSRIENIRRISEVAKLFVDSGLIVLCAFISPFAQDRKFARSLLQKDEFIEIFVDTPIAICEQRDPKGLYKNARLGKIQNFTGISSPYEPPTNPEIYLDNSLQSPLENIEAIVKFLKNKEYI